MLRRTVQFPTELSASQNSSRKILEIGNIVIDLDQYRVTVGGKRIDLTPKEIELLHFLTSHPSRVFTREDLLGYVWNFDFTGGTRTVDAHVKNLRKSWDSMIRGTFKRCGALVILLRWSSMFKLWLKGKYNSLYLKIFMSFLATCVLFFAGLFLFWNYYFTDLFYKDKVELLEKRVVEVTRLMNSVQDGTISTRELKYTVRILARSINGQVWLVDDKGNILNGSSDSEGRTIPKQMDAQFIDGLHGHSGYGMVTLTAPDGRTINLFTYHAPYQLNEQPMVFILYFPAGDISEAISAVRVNILVPLLFSLLAVGFILYIISRKLAGPLQQMNRAALELAHGDFTTRVRSLPTMR